MKVPPLTSIAVRQNFIQSKNNSNAINTQDNGNFELSSYPKNYYLSFEARVNKDLMSFYNRNIDTMPLTLKSYIESLSDDKKLSMSPLEAQYRAFELLEICDTIDDVKSAYPQEPLFQNLKSADDSKGKRGLLYDIRLMKKDSELEDEPVLKGKEDLTIYLLKKIFLEGKTLAEINDDLDKDINELYKKDDKNYILSSTLKALGIVSPKSEYQTSLRYTREGYADKIGEILHQSYLNLSEDEKLRRKQNLRSIRPELTETQLEARRQRMIDFWANLSDERRAEISKNQSAAQKLRYSNMTPEELEKLKENARKTWQNLTPEQKTAQIQGLMTGLERQRISMIHAWNNCPEIRNELSQYLSNQGYHGTQNIIYRTSEFSSGMSKVMSDFWAKNPQFASQLGDAIVSAYIDYDANETDGTLDEFTRKVIKTSDEIKKEIKANKPKKASSKTPAEIERKIFPELFDPNLPISAATKKKLEQTKNIFGHKYLFSKDFPGRRFIPTKFIEDWDEYAYRTALEDNSYYAAKIRLDSNEDMTDEERIRCKKLVEDHNTREITSYAISNAYILAASEVLMRSFIPDNLTLSDVTDKRPLSYLFSLAPVQLAQMVNDAATSNEPVLLQKDTKIPLMFKKYSNPNILELSRLYEKYSTPLTLEESAEIYEKLKPGLEDIKEDEVSYLTYTIRVASKYLLEAINEENDPTERLAVITRLIPYEDMPFLKKSKYIQDLRIQAHNK